MSRIFGLLTIVLGVWITLTLYQEGLENAFGGVLSDAAEPGIDGAQPITRAVEQATEAANLAYEERMNQQLANLEP